MSNEQLVEVATHSLSGAALEWATATAEGEDYLPTAVYDGIGHRHEATSYTTDGDKAMDLMLKNGISVTLRIGARGRLQDVWDAIAKPDFYSSGRENTGLKREVIATGPTPHIAVALCRVVMKFGEIARVPASLLDEGESEAPADRPR